MWHSARHTLRAKCVVHELPEPPRQHWYDVSHLHLAWGNDESGAGLTWYAGLVISGDSRRKVKALMIGSACCCDGCPGQELAGACTCKAQPESLDHAISATPGGRAKAALWAASNGNRN